MVVEPVSGTDRDGEFLPYLHGGDIYKNTGASVLALNRVFEFAADAAKYGDLVQYRWVRGLLFERIQQMKGRAPKS
jgi:hypothetical protein